MSQQPLKGPPALDLWPFKPPATLPDDGVLSVNDTGSIPGNPILGDSGVDTLDGTAEADYILGKGGVDTLNGMLKGGGRNDTLKVMPGAQWLALLFQHVPDKGEHLARYYGWCSNRSRGMRKRQGEYNQPEIIFDKAPAAPDFRRAARAAWARLIRRA